MKRLLRLGLLLVGLVGVPSTGHGQIVRGDQFVFGTGALTASRRVLTGAGSPEGVVTAPVGAVYLRTDGGSVTTAYLKESGAGNTGWIAVASTSGALAQFAATTSAQLRGVLSDEVGTGAAVFENADATLGTITVTSCTGCGSSGAPTDATYITQTANGSLSAEQALATLSSGIMRVATTTGVVTSLTDCSGIAANQSDEQGTCGGVVLSVSPTLTTPNIGAATGTSIALSSAGAHSFGGADARFAINLGGSFTGSDQNTRALNVGTTLTPAAANGNLYGAYLSTPFVEFSSGTHALIAQLAMDPAAVTAGSATVTNSAMIYVSGPLTGTVTGANKSLWIDSGRSDLDGTVFLVGITGGAAGDTDACLNSSTNELTDAGASTCIVSSLRFKDWQGSLDPTTSLAQVRKLTPGRYTYKPTLFTDTCVRTQTDGTPDLPAEAVCRRARTVFQRERVGFTAENMAQVEPRLTVYEVDGVTPRTINFEELTALLASAIQGVEVQFRGRLDRQADLIEGLLTRLAVQEAAMKDLTARVTTLEAR